MLSASRQQAMLLFDCALASGRDIEGVVNAAMSDSLREDFHITPSVY
jgi:hypothetical protein